MISIEGLTDRQRGIMDMLWSCSSLEQVNELVNALPTKQDQYDAKSLVTIATLESIEHELGLTKEYKDAATAAIARARR